MILTIIFQPEDFLKREEVLVRLLTSAVTTGTHFILWSDKVIKIRTQQSRTVLSFCSNTSLASSWSHISSTHSLSMSPGEIVVRILNDKKRHAKWSISAGKDEAETCAENLKLWNKRDVVHVP